MAEQEGEQTAQNQRSFIFFWAISWPLKWKDHPTYTLKSGLETPFPVCWTYVHHSGPCMWLRRTNSSFFVVVTAFCQVFRGSFQSSCRQCGTGGQLWGQDALTFRRCQRWSYTTKQNKGGVALGVILCEATWAVLLEVRTDPQSCQQQTAPGVQPQEESSRQRRLHTAQH